MRPKPDVGLQISDNKKHDQAWQNVSRILVHLRRNKTDFASEGNWRLAFHLHGSSDFHFRTLVPSCNLWIPCFMWPRCGAHSRTVFTFEYLQIDRLWLSFHGINVIHELFVSVEPWLSAPNRTKQVYRGAGIAEIGSDRLKMTIIFL
jgi:hypothetical protein